MATDREIIKYRQAGQAQTFGCSDPTGETAKIHTRYFEIKKTAADAMASSATAETATPVAPCPEKCRVKKVVIRSNAILAADNTDYVTATVKYRDSTGGNAVTVAVYDSRAANNGALVAYAPTTLTLTDANIICAADGCFTLTVAKGGSGKVLDISTFTIHAESV